MVIYAPHHGEVWMTVWEIAELLNVTGTAVKNTIKRIWKQSGLKDFQHSQYIKLKMHRKPLPDICKPTGAMLEPEKTRTPSQKISRKSRQTG